MSDTETLFWLLGISTFLAGVVIVTLLALGTVAMGFIVAGIMKLGIYVRSLWNVE